MLFTIYRSSDRFKTNKTTKEFNTLEELIEYGKQVSREPHGITVDSNNQLIINFISNTIEIYDSDREYK